MADPEIKIRKYEKKDRQFIREIACATAFIGKDSSAFFDDREIMADALTLYFTDYEPESCFVAENKNEIIGYLTGTKDEAAMNKVSGAKIFWPLFLKSLKKGALFRKKNFVFLLHCLISSLKGEFRLPVSLKEYPAVLHINLKEGSRSLGIGAGLIKAYLDYLKENKVQGVHLATMSSRAADFFSQQGFKLLFSAKRSYFSHILHEDITVYVYGRHL
ncbi:MAG: GNAT family N-acetyltransferase [Candidatus Omnitrophica bacterium]|nr:GNAT family N-acetyltransferase [Candidatus Omnitrophota bacterium]MDD5236053.1 GNAT family N-acetyltransferase [Candidatus Omnitrophota bacterium]MDD5609927.1 GNAT family N-acetyltransferase [Candidatus Omnitrophota bacterium]